MEKILISLFDYSGNASEPYRRNGWKVIQVDKKRGIDLLKWDYVQWYQSQVINEVYPAVGIIAMIPCTAYALSGNRHKKSEARKAIFKDSQKLAARTKEIIDFFDNMRLLLFWQVENPMSDIHKHNPWLGKVRMQFDPCDFALYDPCPENSRYNKRTWLWGSFDMPIKKRLEPIAKDNPGWKNLGGKSEKTKELRSITPLGFSYAFYEANN